MKSIRDKLLKTKIPKMEILIALTGYLDYREIYKLRAVSPAMLKYLETIKCGPFKFNPVDAVVFRSKISGIFADAAYLQRAVEIFGVGHIQTLVNDSYRYGRVKELIGTTEILEVIAEHRLIKLHWGDLYQFSAVMTISDKVINYVKSLQCKYTVYIFWLFVNTHSPILREMLECKLPEDFAQSYAEFIVYNQQHIISNMSILQKFEDEHLLEIFGEILKCGNISSIYSDNLVNKAIKLGNAEVLQIIFRNSREDLLTHFPKEMVLEEFKKYISGIGSCKASLVRYVLAILEF